MSLYTYVSSEHVVCFANRNTVEQNYCNCIDTLKNQIYFTPFAKKREDFLN